MLNMLNGHLSVSVQQTRRLFSCHEKQCLCVKVVTALQDSKNETTYMVLGSRGGVGQREVKGRGSVGQREVWGRGRCGAEGSVGQREGSVGQRGGVGQRDALMVMNHML
jgi:hypothetical protein